MVEELALEAEGRLTRLRCANVDIRVGDGSRGWAEHAPFDKILVAAAADVLPPTLVEQLRPGGRMVLPLGGEEAQALTVVEKGSSGQVKRRELLRVTRSVGSKRWRNLPVRALARISMPPASARSSSGGATTPWSYRPRMTRP